MVDANGHLVSQISAKDASKVMGSGDLGKMHHTVGAYLEYAASLPDSRPISENLASPSCPLLIVLRELCSMLAHPKQLMQFALA